MAPTENATLVIGILALLVGIGQIVVAVLDRWWPP